jgi:hypothetical protein
MIASQGVATDEGIPASTEISVDCRANLALGATCIRYEGHVRCCGHGLADMSGNGVDGRGYDDCIGIGYPRCQVGRSIVYDSES